jgi:hypothetical protein
MPIGPDGRSLAFNQELEVYVDDALGFTLPPWPRNLAEQENAVSRFADLLKRSNNSYEFGLIRRDALAQTGLMRDFFGSGEVMLMELALRGPFSMLDEKLFLKRFHPTASFCVAEADKERWLNPAADPSTQRRRFRFTRAYLQAIRDAQSLSKWERSQCFALVAGKTTRALVGRFLTVLRSEIRVGGRPKKRREGMPHEV